MTRSLCLLLVALHQHVMLSLHTFSFEVHAELHAEETVEACQHSMSAVYLRCLCQEGRRGGSGGVPAAALLSATGQPA